MIEMNSFQLADEADRLAACGELAESLALLERALRGFEATLDPEDPDAELYWTAHWEGKIDLLQSLLGIQPRINPTVLALQTELAHKRQPTAYPFRDRLTWAS